jgi:hypothetical protein
LGRLDTFGKLVKNYAGQISERLGFRTPGVHPPEASPR